MCVCVVFAASLCICIGLWGTCWMGHTHSVWCCCVILCHVVLFCSVLFCSGLVWGVGLWLWLTCQHNTTQHDWLTDLLTESYLKYRLLLARNHDASRASLIVPSRTIRVRWYSTHSVSKRRRIPLRRWMEWMNQNPNLRRTFQTMLTRTSARTFFGCGTNSKMHLKIIILKRRVVYEYSTVRTVQSGNGTHSTPTNWTNT